MTGARARASLAAVALAASLAGSFAAPDARAQVGASLVIAADRDDDDVDGVADGEQAEVPLLARADLAAIDASWTGGTLEIASGADRVRMVVAGKPRPLAGVVPPGASLQGLEPGRVIGAVTSARGRLAFTIDVVLAGFRDGQRRAVSPAKEHASIVRTAPARPPEGADAAYDDPDALRVTLESHAQAALPGELRLESVTPVGTTLDTLRVPELAAIPCRDERRCLASAPIRLVFDEIDRRHPLVEARSLRVEVGGAVVVRAGSKKLSAIRVQGPRASALGPMTRLRAKIRAFVVRIAPGGAPAIGGNDQGALVAARSELALAGQVWGQCGIAFPPPGAIDVRIVNPPPPHLVSFGNDVGLPATGGQAELKIEGRAVSLPIAPRATPSQVATAFARAVERAGFVAIVSENARTLPGALPSVDVSVRKQDGSLAQVELAQRPTEPTLTVQVGHVDFANGLEHFTDMDSVAGTIEERTLVKALEDGDPRTIEVIVVPSFAGGGRIGESFITSDGSSVRNVVLFDRAGVRARKSSLTLAHELGHVLLDMPGHPDDYGVDTPTLLMDSDASDASPFGPRRITVDECARAVRQSGPKARVPLLEPWPLAPLKY